jgi:hypothetical protein
VDRHLRSRGPSSQEAVKDSHALSLAALEHPVDQPLKGLKVDSGEHLAAILLTAFLNTPPSDIDVKGGIDLLFQLGAADRLDGMFPAQSVAAFEVKSLRGESRRFHSEINRDEKRGVVARGRGTSVTIKSAKDIFTSGLPELRRSADQLDRKVQAGFSRNAFLIVHSFEHMAAEAVSSIVMSPHLPPVPTGIDLDSVWVLWVPDHLTMRSPAEQQWIEMMFHAFDPDDPIDANASYHDPSVLQAASLRLMSKIRPGAADPYAFGLRARNTDAGANSDSANP